MRKFENILNEIEKLIETEQLQEATNKMFDNFPEEFNDSELVAGGEVIEMMEGSFFDINIDGVENLEDGKFYKSVDTEDMIIVSDLVQEDVSELLQEIKYNLYEIV